MMPRDRNIMQFNIAVLCPPDLDLILILQLNHVKSAFLIFVTVIYLEHEERFLRSWYIKQSVFIVLKFEGC